MSVVTQEIQDQVSELYITFFGRAPDAVGFAHWAQSLANGATVSQIAQSFSQTPEFESQYGGLTPDQQIARFYENVLNRAPDADGLAYWVGQVNSGIPFYDVAYTIVNTAFVGGPGVGAQDNALVMNKVAVSEYFALTLASNDFAVAQTAFVGLTDTAESLAAKEAELDAAVNAGTTYTLTTGIDTINVVGAQAATVVGVQQTTNPTWNTGDSITGNGKTTVSLTANGGTASIVTLNNINELNNNLTANTTIDASEFTNVAQTWIRSGVSGTALTLDNDDLTTAHGISVARGVTYNINSVATGSADEAVLVASGAGLKATDRATFDVSGGNAVEAVSLVTAGTNYVNIIGGSTTAAIEISGDGTNNTLISGAAAVMTVDASATTGKNTVNVGTLLSTGDTILGGTGVDTLTADLAAALPISATVSGFETLDLKFTAAATYNASKTTGATELRITPDAAVKATVSNLSADVQTIRYGSTAAITATGDQNIGYATGANSDVTLVVGATPTTGTAAVSIGAVNLTGNKGGLTVESIGSTANTVGVITANSASSVSIGGVSQNLTTGAINATSAATVTVDGSAKNTRTGLITLDESTSEINITSSAGTATVSSNGLVGGNGVALASSAADRDISTTLNISSGAKAVIVGTVGVTATGVASNVDATVNVDGGVGTVGTGVMTFTGGAAPTDTFAVNVNATATDGTVTVAGVTLNENSSTASANQANVSLVAAGGDVVLSELTLTNIGETNLTVSSDDGDTVTISDLIGTVNTGIGELTSITAIGAGDIVIGKATASVLDSIGGDTVVDATATTGNFTLYLANAFDGNGTAADANDVTVYLGNAATDNTNTVVTGAGADTIFGGSGVDVVTGGAGADYIETRGGDDTVNAGTGADTVSVGTGDNVVFQTAGDSVAANGDAGAFDTAGALTTSSTITFGNGVDVITDFNVANDIIDQSVAVDWNGYATTTSGTGVDGATVAIRGNWDGSVFTYSTTGADALVIIDIQTGSATGNLTATDIADDAVILVGVGGDLTAANFIL